MSTAELMSTADLVSGGRSSPGGGLASGVGDASDGGDASGGRSSPGGGLAPLVGRAAPPAGRRRRWAAALVVVGVAVAVGMLVNNLLGDAALFFYNADEAVERRDELGSRRFRVQGTPLAEAVESFDADRPVLVFAVGFEGAVVDVVHTGDPPELFQPGVPVVLEGVWARGSGPVAADGWHFASDRMLVKHDNDYRNKDDYDQRLVDADRGGSPS